MNNLVSQLKLAWNTWRALRRYKQLVDKILNIRYDKLEHNAARIDEGSLKPEDHNVDDWVFGDVDVKLRQSIAKDIVKVYASYKYIFAHIETALDALSPK